MQQPGTPGMQVKVFNVGQGSCTVVTFPGQPSLLVDAGSDQIPPEGKEAIQSKISSYISENSPHGVSIIISHAEKDHAGWIQEIISQLLTNINNVTVGGPKEKYTKFLSPTYYIHDCNSITNCHPSHLPTYCSLWSTGFGQQKTNDQSIIVCVEDADFRVVLPGDSGSKTFNSNSILSSKKLTYLLANHHGSHKEGANSPESLLLLQPKVVVISSGMREGYYHPTYQTLTNFSRLLQMTTKHPHLISGETAPNLIGTEQIQSVINYTGKFSTYRTCAPIATTNNMGDITITSQGITSQNFLNADNANDVLCSALRYYFPTYNFNTIKHLFLARMTINDQHIEKFNQLPVALTYFDLQNNRIGTSGFARLIELLQSRRNKITIKTDNNEPTDADNLSQKLTDTTCFSAPISLAWNNIAGKRTFACDPVTQLKEISIVCAPKAPSSNHLDYNQLQGLLLWARQNKANAYSTQLFSNESEFFIHFPYKTVWYSGLYNFTPVELPHQNVIMVAAWHQNDNFFLTDEKYTYIYEQKGNEILFKNSVEGAPYFCKREDQQDVICPFDTIITRPFDGKFEQDVRDLSRSTSCFSMLQPITQKSDALLTIQNGCLRIHTKDKDGSFVKKLSQSFPGIKSASFCDADQSVRIHCNDGEKILPLIMETI